MKCVCDWTVAIVDRGNGLSFGSAVGHHGLKSMLEAIRGY